MAAGEGTRLRPLTERWPKPILPIDGRPVIATLLRDLASAGCDDVTVVTGHLAEKVEQLLGDGSAFGTRIRYARQDVKALSRLYERVIAEFERHPIDLQETKAFSPASIGKAYLRSLGVLPRGGR